MVLCIYLSFWFASLHYLVYLVSRCLAYSANESMKLMLLVGCQQWPEFSVNFPNLGSFKINPSFFKKFDYSDAAVCFLFLEIFRFLFCLG